MALGGIDLNLLVVLQALLEEGNVTRAGARLRMPQPAVSNALARLRRHYKDELLLRTGNGYDLTPLARSLLPSVQDSTRLTGHTFSPEEAGQPAIGDRTFTICLSDYSMTVLGEPLVRRVHDLAPEASIQMRLATKDLTDGDRGLLGYDLVIAPPHLEADTQPEVIVRDRIVYLADPANPRLRDGRLTVEDLAALPHAAARFPDPWSDPAALVLLRRGIRPNVVLTTGGWLPLPFLIAGTDLVAAVPERLARRVSGAAGVAVAEVPLGVIELVEAAWWHPLHATDPGLTWLRGIVAEVTASLATVPALPGQRQPGDAGRGSG
ncbi:MAG TPA: LysR family transcriptional regulator [Trebonia sp.]|nr:LysR family transcriptional regulator [Trebonia sp.]